eukprot:3932027-Rhodomonas_salina.3
MTTTRERASLLQSHTDASVHLWARRPRDSRSEPSNATHSADSTNSNRHREASQASRRLKHRERSLKHREEAQASRAR